MKLNASLIRKLVFYQELLLLYALLTPVVYGPGPGHRKSSVKKTNPRLDSIVFLFQI